MQQCAQAIALFGYIMSADLDTLADVNGFAPKLEGAPVAHPCMPAAQIAACSAGAMRSVAMNVDGSGAGSGVRTPLA